MAPAARRSTAATREVPPYSMGLDRRLDCHIHDRRRFREMRGDPPGHERPHAHEEYGEEQDEADLDRRGWL
jgi:hypothetical protein